MEDIKVDVPVSGTGALVDKLFELRQQKAAYDKIVDDIKADISSIEAKLIQSMRDSSLEKVSTGSGTVSMKVELYPKIEDKTAFFQWGAENNKPEMFVLQANRAAFKEYFEQFGEYPPGTDGYMAEKLSVRKKG